MPAFHDRPSALKKALFLVDKNKKSNMDTKERKKTNPSKNEPAEAVL